MGCLPKWNHCSKGCSVFFFCFFVKTSCILGVFMGNKIQIRSLSSLKPLYSGFTVIGPALISHPVRALIRAKPVAWGFSLHKGAAGSSTCGKTRVWRETRTKRGAVRRGNTNGRSFLGRQSWRSFLGRQCWRSFLGCQYWRSF
jgi:hypothetical protein